MRAANTTRRANPPDPASHPAILDLILGHCPPRRPACLFRRRRVVSTCQDAAPNRQDMAFCCPGRPSAARTVMLCDGCSLPTHVAFRSTDSQRQRCSSAGLSSARPTAESTMGQPVRDACACACACACMAPTPHHLIASASSRSTKSSGALTKQQQQQDHHHHHHHHQRHGEPPTRPLAASLPRLTAVSSAVSPRGGSDTMTVETDPSAWASQQPAAWFCRLHAQRAGCGRSGEAAA